MRVISRRFEIEALEGRDVPAMFVPILSPHAVNISTPDHWHAAVVRPVQPQGEARLLSFSLAARAPIGPILDFPAGIVRQFVEPD